MAKQADPDDSLWTNDIAAAVNGLYDKLPKNGKPLKDGEFTVLAAVVAVVATKSIVISLATGTKSAGEETIDAEGRVLHDSHAEVLARRGFVRYLLLTLEALQQNPQYHLNDCCCLEPTPPKSSLKADESSSDVPHPSREHLSSDPFYRLKPSWVLYLYISDSPCGDASIYDTISSGTTFTGAKLVKPPRPSSETSSSAPDESNSGDEIVLRERAAQVLGSLRTKCGRSDVTDRSYSMSCSDKICRWLALGLQG